MAVVLDILSEKGIRKSKGRGKIQDTPRARAGLHATRKGYGLACTPVFDVLI